MRIASCIFVVLLAGCAAQAAGPSASVNVGTLVKAHPLYSTLAQYDRQIAVLRGTLHVPAFEHRNQALDDAARAARSTLDEASSRARDIAAMPSPDVQTLQDDSKVSAPSEAQVQSDMQQNYARQSSQMQAAAQQDMGRYRASLLAQQDTALSNYERSVRARVQQAYASRQQELYEKESTLALDLAKADADKRLAIRTKLQTLALDGARRHALIAQLAVIQAHEDAVVAKQRTRDQATLAAFLPPLQARAQADIARMQADLQKRTAANLAARERVLAAQRVGATRLNLGPTAGSATATDMRGELDALLRAQPADPNAFLSSRDELGRQFTSVRSADDDASRATYAQIADLEAARAQLYEDILSQIMREAQAVAGSRGFGHVYAAQEAPSGSVDITRDVANNLAQLIL